MPENMATSGMYVNGYLGTAGCIRPTMESFWIVLALKAIAVLALAAFLPFTARSYYHFRHRQRQGEIVRIFEKLKISSRYEKIYSAEIFPAIAFIIGMFPQRGVNWITSRLSFLSQESHPSVQDLPLGMIEGVDAHDKIRLTELGVDNCYDLAAADFIPLLIKTPYNARELIDWILQAKLCVKFGRGIKDLREHGLRTIVDLEDLNETTIEELSKETQLRLSSLTRAKKAVGTDNNIKRLQKAAQLLSEYWENESEIEPLPKKPRISMA